VQGVGFDAPILGQFRSVLLKEMLQEMDLHAVQFSMLGDRWGQSCDGERGHSHE
jgi:hypothetical protein